MIASPCVELRKEFALNLFFGTLLTVIGLLVAGYVFEWLMERRDRKRFPAPGKLVQVGNCKMHLHLGGERREGEPLILLEAGMASWSFYWRIVQPELSRFGRVCSYDRFGFGWSDHTREIRNPQRIAAELHQALQSAGETGPYLLVGHSFGGILVRQFARLYPDEVMGMVLVDSAHEDQIERMPWARHEAKNIKVFFTLLAVMHRLGILRLIGKSLLGNFTSLKTEEEKRVFLAILLASRYFETSRNESLSLLNPPRQDERLVSLNEKPLIVIQAGGRPDPLPREYTEERWREQRRAWDAIQQDLLALSTNSRLVIAEKSIHNVQIEQPEIVVDAVKEILKRNHGE
jgi:pimeloyl-ACP methyl ester carboxylesterase